MIFPGARCGCTSTGQAPTRCVRGRLSFWIQNERKQGTTRWPTWGQGVTVSVHQNAQKYCSSCLEGAVEAWCDKAAPNNGFISSRCVRDGRERLRGWEKAEILRFFTLFTDRQSFFRPRPTSPAMHAFHKDARVEGKKCRRSSKTDHMSREERSEGEVGEVRDMTTYIQETTAQKTTSLWCNAQSFNVRQRTVMCQPSAVAARPKTRPFGCILLEGFSYALTAHKTMRLSRQECGLTCNWEQVTTKDAFAEMLQMWRTSKAAA